MLMSQAASFSSAGVTLTSYQDIPAAIAKLTASKTQIAAGIATIESAQTQVSDGKTQLDDAMKTLNKSQISGIMEMSQGICGSCNRGKPARAGTEPARQCEGDCKGFRRPE